MKNQDYSIQPFIDHKCIFVHIPKCAGISINKSLFGNLGCGHATIGQYLATLGVKRFDSFFKFTIVRNPWDRLVSAFFFLKNGGMNRFDKDFADKHLYLYNDFEAFVHEWVNKENIRKYIHFLPQGYFLCIGNSEPLVDFIGYYENIEEDYKKIASRIGSKKRLDKLNFRKNKKKYSSYYSSEMLKIVGDVYQKDVDMFGYDFKSSTTIGLQ